MKTQYIIVALVLVLIIAFYMKKKSNVSNPVGQTVNDAATEPLQNDASQVDTTAAQQLLSSITAAQNQTPSVISPTNKTVFSTPTVAVQNTMPVIDNTSSLPLHIQKLMASPDSLAI